MATTQDEVFDVERVHPFDGERRPVLLAHPGMIAAGDWLRDLGTFRQVLRLESLPGSPGAGPTTIVYFVPQPGVPDLALGITWSVPVTVWRDLARPIRTEEIMTSLQVETRQAVAGRSLVDRELFARLTARVAADEHVGTARAERIVDQALAFLGACAVSTQQLSPSATVDIGWHTFILHTKDYRDFCQRVADRFIDHVPTGGDGLDCEGDEKHSRALSAPLSALAVIEAGYIVDAAMWENAAKCSQCHNGCSNDPPPDPKAHLNPAPLG